MRAALTLLIISALAATAHAGGADSEPGGQCGVCLPRPAPRQFVLWAWERPEDLRFVGRDAEIRFLAGTVLIRDDGADFLPRRQPLYVEKDAVVRPVVHIGFFENASLTKASQQTIEKVVKLLVAVGEKYDSLQIDFDARLSERERYVELLKAVRRELPEQSSLSITGLASWCDDGAWLDGAPIDELAPQYFRMGKDSQRISQEPRGPCRESLGLSMDELPSAVPSAARKIYLFNPKRWTAQAFSEAKRRFGE